MARSTYHSILIKMWSPTSSLLPIIAKLLRLMSVFTFSICSFKSKFIFCSSKNSTKLYLSIFIENIMLYLKYAIPLIFWNHTTKIKMSKKWNVKKTRKSLPQFFELFRNFITPKLLPIKLYIMGYNINPMYFSWSNGHLYKMIFIVFYSTKNYINIDKNVFAEINRNLQEINILKIFADLMYFIIVYYVIYTAVSYVTIL